MSLCVTECLLCVFFFKQKTAYEMRISDWSSDVCSSDLELCQGEAAAEEEGAQFRGLDDQPVRAEALFDLFQDLYREGLGHAVRRNVGRLGGAAHQGAFARRRGDRRSEEHTSELQSLMRISYAVFCLKKKKQKLQNEIKSHTPHHHTQHQL